MSNTPIVRMSGLSKQYRTDAGDVVQALSNVDLNVRDGEFLVLIGPTGCGKTTLLNIMAGLDHQDSGTLTRDPELKPGVNMPCVFQHYTLFPWRSLLRNVTFGLQMRGTPRTSRHEAARQLLHKVGLAGFEEAYPHELSGGMRQRAAVAQALAVGPRLLFMDEPFGAVDDSTRGELQRMISQLWMESPITILLVTHSIDEAVTLADRIMVLSDRPGRITQEIPVDMPRPRDPESREYIELFVEVREAVSRKADSPEPHTTKP